MKMNVELDSSHTDVKEGKKCTPRLANEATFSKLDREVNRLSWNKSPYVNIVFLMVLK